MEFAAWYLAGLFTLPVLLFVSEVVGVLCRTVRDTWRLFGGGLKPEYSRWIWFYYLPLVFWVQFRNQCHAWLHGYETKIVRR